MFASATAASVGKQPVLAVTLWGAKPLDTTLGATSTPVRLKVPERHTVRPVQPALRVVGQRPANQLR